MPSTRLKVPSFLSIFVTVKGGGTPLNANTARYRMASGLIGDPTAPVTGKAGATNRKS